ncbi:hypothetical protein [Serratia fonticola]|uniref:hypothetical protein n=1 Tax=Serratia fonticola TaxID=47917 RepID=UPI00093C2C1C|nr:hypothetical protein [Serratia fonticola]OKP17064.1 hypothetical protein BSQ40_28840 [Serratia fonticola]
MNKIYTVDERFQIIDENLKKLHAQQQFTAQMLCAFIISTGNKTQFVEYVKNASTDIEEMKEPMEHARTVLLTLLDSVQSKP